MSSWKGDPGSLSDVVGGEPVETPHGRCFLARREYPLTYVYGGQPLQAGLAAAGGSLAALARDPRLAECSLREACFLDTETTGLAGGTGTYVFMVGVGFTEGDFFSVEQYFMRDYDDEPALVHLLEERLGRFGLVVSFNGKVFDLPLLETRFIFSRRRLPLAGKPHLDLLFPSRRLWARRLENCRLANLERLILDEARTGDVPGADVPEHYFRYLRTADPWVIRPVFDHNRQDVLSLVALAGRAAASYEAFLDAPPPATADPLDLFSLARVYRDAGLLPPAARCYRSCLESSAGLPEALTERAALDCLRLLRRLGRVNEAVELAARLADGPPLRLWPFVELAKDLEHRLRDYRRALSVVDRALGLLTADPTSPPAFARALERRRHRLGHKARRAEGWDSAS